MPGAIEFINSFTSDLENVEDKWDNFVVNPFTEAYIEAFKSFNKTLSEQKEADGIPGWLKSLGMLALSLCGGGVMTAAFGTTAIRTIAGNAAQKFANNTALDFIVKHNMERAFRAADFLANNKTGNFIAGKLWDTVESGVGDYAGDKFKKAKESMMQNPASFPSIDKFVKEPMNIYLSLSTFVGEAKIKCHDLAAAIRDDAKASDEKKIADVKKLKDTSPLFNPPQKSIAHPGLAGEIELSFYLYMVMEKDYLETNYVEELIEAGSKGQGWRRTGYYYPTKSTPIDVSPASKDYPKSTPGPGRPGSQNVAFGRLGGVIVKRLNELHKAKFHNPFFDGKIEASTIVSAEQAIGVLANGNIKRLVNNKL